MRFKSPLNAGSKNPGATNVLRLGGKKAAIITLLGDIFKGVICVIAANILNLTVSETAYIVLATIIGHTFPVFLNFQGGKGVAVLIGGLLAFHWIIGIIFFVTWLVSALATKFSSVASLISTSVATLCVLFCSGLITAIPFFVITAIVILRHHGNIRRLISGTENKISWKTSA